MRRRISSGRLKRGDWSCVKVVGNESAAGEEVKGLDGAVRARGLIAGRVLGLSLGAELGFRLLEGQSWRM